ncbi:MAG TPA: SpoIIE family protein phosphatase [Streptosporangiaceae bacterium]|nr:SpoIIE family protein phosphatase [Streptosporangiaceae bacterium]
MTVNDETHVARLTAVIARQRRELGELSADAAARAVVDLARGVLIARLGCTPAQAGSQLVKIAEESGIPLIQLASEIIGLPATPAADRQADITQQPAPQPWLTSAALAGAAMELASDGADLAEAMLTQTLAGVGAVAVAIWIIMPDGAIELLGQAGLGPGEASRWRRMPPAMTALPARAASTGAEFWWHSGRPAGDQTPLIGHWDSGARAVLPLLTGNGHLIGSLEVCWPTALDEFPAVIRRQVSALADLVVQALSLDSHRPRQGNGQVDDGNAAWVLGLLDGLHESALFARAMREQAGEPSDFRIVHVSPGFRDPAGRSATDLVGQSLIEAYPDAAMPGGLYHRALQVMATGEPQHVSGEVIGGVTSSGQVAIANVRIARLLDGVVITWRHAADVDRLAALLGHAQRLGRFGGWEENLAAGTIHWTEPMFSLFGIPSGQPVSLSELDSRVVADDVGVAESFRARLLHDKVATAALFRVVRRDDGSIRQVRAFAEPVTDHYGELIAVRGTYQDVSAHYHTELALAATREVLSDTEERAEEEHRLALRLQEAITPQSSHLVEAAGLDVAARYRPAGKGHLVSGDWYDAVPLPTKQVMLVVGDVAGHGIEAVTGMVALRNCLRGLAITGAGPGSLLSWLNSVACHLTEDTLGTAICGLYDPEQGELRWARAGHLPAVLVRNARARPLSQPHGVLLGADADGCYEEASTTLRPGDTLLLFTDGLIERRDQAIDESIRTLLKVASRPVADVDSYADLLVAELASDTDDDACLVAVAVR